ncbi:MAG: SDR family oxidoreductase [Clostridiales bacterium]|jgi:NAD(P)-dependent dehydrogenase (short-subunit alcohol dehydrogenase family)|nr:SDR family oxidoreductase [Clostridiales bacterium]
MMNKSSGKHINYDRLLEGKTAVVTSGAHGMGKYIAKVLIRHGATCVINGMNPEGERTAEEFRKDAPGCFFVRCDMSDRDDTLRFIEEVNQRAGHVDIVVNNVGINRSDFTGQVEDARFEYTQQVNLYGTMRMVRGFLPGMKKTGGAFVHISTIHSVVGMPPNTAYASSKSAINAFSGAVAAEYAAYGIRSNVINPGGIFTGNNDEIFAEIGDDREKLIERGRHGDYGQPDYGGGSAYDIANSTLFLVSGLSRHITGAVIKVDGGTVNQAHRFYDRRLPEDSDELWYQVMKNRFTSVEDI